MIEELDSVLLRCDQLAVSAGPDAALYRHCFFSIYERLSMAKKHSQNLVGGGGGVLPIMWPAYHKLQVKSFLFKTGSSSHTVS